MAIKTYKPTTPSRRHMTVSAFEGIDKKAKPERKLTEVLKKNAGRNSYGRITVRHHGGGNKQKYRIIDFKRDKTDMFATVLRLEYDPNRSAYIALVEYEDGERRYVIAPVGLTAGDKIISSASADIKPGNCLPIANIPVGTVIHNIEMHPGKGAQLVRSAGAAAQLMAKENGDAQIRMPSGEVRIVRTNCTACIGQVGNLDHENIQVCLGVEAESVFDLEFESDDEDAPLSAINVKDRPFTGPIVYTGPLDELFLSRFGRLPYRSLDFVYETHDADHVLPCGTVNFTVTEDYTRITEFKYLTGQETDKTTIMKEYSHSYDDPKTQTPYYAIINDENAAHYERYRALTKSLPNFHPLGRLAEYRYYNMDVIIGRALALADELVG